MDKTLIVTNLPDEVYRALQKRAAERGRSVETEARLVLEKSLRPSDRVRMGDALVALGQNIGLEEEDVEDLERICMQLRRSQ